MIRRRTELFAGWAVAALLCGSVHAAIVIQSVDTDSASSSMGAPMTASVSASSTQVGDMIVLTAATNKKLNIEELSAAQVGGTGLVGSLTRLTNDPDTYPTAYSWYASVTTAGDFSFDLTGNALTVGVAMYVLRADSGAIALADFDTWDDTDGDNNDASYPLSYSFSRPLSDGVLIEAINARTDNISGIPVSYTTDFSSADKRLLVSYDGVSGSSWTTSSYTLSGGTPGIQTSGALGMVFVESLPEPSTLAMMGFASLILYGARRKRDWVSSEG